MQHTRRIRNYLSPLLWIIVGVVIGSAMTITAARASRNPGGFLFGLRIALGMPSTGSYEIKWLERTYGPEKKSHGAEEWIIRDFFQDKRDGVFVDVGSANYMTGSNTFFLENQLGWSGLAVDAQESYRPGYTEHRPRTQFFAFFVSDRSDEKMQFFLNANTELASWRGEFSERIDSRVKGPVEITTITLNDLLTAQHIDRIDFLSMDIELAEPLALAGFDIQRFRPQLVSVEAYPEVRQQILDYFASHDYVVVSKYLRIDNLNLWFMPLGSHVDSFPEMAENKHWLVRWWSGEESHPH